MTDQYHICGDFPEPKEGSVFYEDEVCYACLAFESKSEGHTIVAWKEHVSDLDDLTSEQYCYLMNVVLRVRKAVRSVYDATQVYIDYWNETGHVHFHLIPRSHASKRGPELLMQPTVNLTDLSCIPKLRKRVLL